MPMCSLEARRCHLSETHRTQTKGITSDIMQCDHYWRQLDADGMYFLPLNSLEAEASAGQMLRQSYRPASLASKAYLTSHGPLLSNFLYLIPSSKPSKPPPQPVLHLHLLSPVAGQALPTCSSALRIALTEEVH